MAKTQRGEQRAPKSLLWLHGEVKTPPFTPEGRQETGMLLRLLQEGEQLGMPQAEFSWEPETLLTEAPHADKDLEVIAREVEHTAGA